MNVIFLVLCLVGMLAAYALLVRLLRTVLCFIDELIDLAVALFFFLVIAPPLWLWHKARRPMWRTLTKDQTNELEAWLRRAN